MEFAIPSLPPGASVDPSTRVAIGPDCGVDRMSGLWQGRPMVVLVVSTPRGAARLRTLVAGLRSKPGAVPKGLVLGGRFERESAWLALSTDVVANAGRRASVGVESQAGHGTGVRCVAALKGALGVLAALGAEQSAAPAGIDWLSCDAAGRWVPNFLDPGLWTPEAGRTWQTAAYDVAWSVALGHLPTLHDPPPEKAMQDCPPWLADHLHRLAGHGVERFTSIREAQGALGEMRTRRRTRRVVAVAVAAVTIAVASLAWVDARICAEARVIEERTGLSPFERRQQLAATVAAHPLLLFGRWGVQERLQRLGQKCDEAVVAWQASADALLRGGPDADGAEGKAKGLLAQAEPFRDDVKDMLGPLRALEARAHAAATVARAGSSPAADMAKDLVAAAHGLRERGLAADPLLRRLGEAWDNARWRRMPAVPGPAADPTEVDRYVDGLREYRSDQPEDAEFGQRIRLHEQQSRDAETIALRKRDEARLAQLDERIEQGTKARNLVPPTSMLLRFLGDRPQSDWMQAQLRDRAKSLQQAQRGKLEGMASEPLVDQAKALTDWVKLVATNPEAFPPEAQKQLARAFAVRVHGAIMPPKSLSGVPAVSGTPIEAALLVAGASLSERLNAAAAYMRDYVDGSRSLGSAYRAVWFLNQCAEELDLKRAAEILRFPRATALVVTLRRPMEDRWGWDWEVRVALSYPLLCASAGVSAVKGGNPDDQLVFPLEVADGGVFVPAGSKLELEVYRVNYGPNERICKCAVEFDARGVHLVRVDGDPGAIDVALWPAE